jgi:hypothetical protein
MALAGDRNLRRVADPAPGCVQGGVLAETGLVGEDQRPVLRMGFLGWGQVRRCQRSLLLGSGTRQHPSPALHGEAQPVKQFANMPGMVMHAELPLDDQAIMGEVHTPLSKP